MMEWFLLLRCFIGIMCDKWTQLVWMTLRERVTLFLNDISHYSGVGLLIRAWAQWLSFVQYPFPPCCAVLRLLTHSIQSPLLVPSYFHPSCLISLRSFPTPFLFWTNIPTPSSICPDSSVCAVPIHRILLLPLHLSQSHHAFIARQQRLVVFRSPVDRKPRASQLHPAIDVCHPRQLPHHTHLLSPTVALEISESSTTSYSMFRCFSNACNRSSSLIFPWRPSVPKMIPQCLQDRAFSTSADRSRVILLRSYSSSVISSLVLIEMAKKQTCRGCSEALARWGSWSSRSIP